MCFLQKNWARDYALEYAHVTIGGTGCVEEVNNYQRQEVGLKFGLTLAEISEPWAQDRYCARSLGGGAKNRFGNGEEKRRVQ